MITCVLFIVLWKLGIYRAYKGLCSCASCLVHAILEDGSDILHDWPTILTFLNPIQSLFRLKWSYWPPFYAGTTRLSLSHLVPEIIGPKVGLIFHQILSFDRFEHFIQICCLIFELVFIVLKFVWPLIFPNPMIWLSPFHFFIMLCPLPTQDSYSKKNFITPCHNLQKHIVWYLKYKNSNHGPGKLLLRQKHCCYHRSNPGR